jgi:flagellar motor protein MotB
MQVLYVAGFDIAAAEGAPPGTDPSQVVLDLLGQWIGGQSDPAINSAELLEDGNRELAQVVVHGALRRTAAWEHVSGEDAWATRVERRDVSVDGSEFITRVTVGDDEDGTSVRVSMAREVAAAGLTPAPVPDLRQPGIVATLAQDPRLDVRVDGQVQDGRYEPVRSSQEVELLANVLSEAGRLPVLLLHTRTLEARSGAQRVASRLIGLVKVVTLDYRAARALHALMPSIEVPYAGGLLVWADVAAPPGIISAPLLNAPDRDVLRTALMSRIAPLSVLTRGVDEAYRRARISAQSHQSLQAAQRTAEAEGAGDAEAQLAALRAELEVTKNELAYVYDECGKAEQDAKDRSSEVAVLRAQVEQLTIAQAYQPPAAEAEEAETFDNAPTLEVGNPSSLETLSQHLERVSQGRIVFTPNAVTAWRRADRYPTPDEMRDGLVKLAKIAHDVIGGHAEVRGHTDTWARENYDVKISLQDDDMPKKFRTFTWEDTSYDRTPHVKVNDWVDPHKCGRIYFAIDNANARYIVDHVGLHW